MKSHQWIADEKEREHARIKLEVERKEAIVKEKLLKQKNIESSIKKKGGRPKKLKKEVERILAVTPLQVL